MMHGNPSDVLQRLAEWYHDGHRAVLVTVLEAQGDQLSPAGTLTAIRDDGLVCGTLSSGAVEQALAAELKAGKLFVGATRVSLRGFGTAGEGAARNLLPDGARLRLAIERKVDSALLAMTLNAIRQRRIVRRTVWFSDGRALLSDADDLPSFVETEESFSHLLASEMP
jgi:xanthine dehydrogenase accessory factor